MTASDTISTPLPRLVAVACYAPSVYYRVMPVGVVHAIRSGLGMAPFFVRVMAIGPFSNATLS